jgi:mannose-1-phosphate guanylyltransferase
MESVRAEMLRAGYNASGQSAHEAEVSYSASLGLSESEAQFLDRLRYFRNSMVYYGKSLDEAYAKDVVSFMRGILNRISQDAPKAIILAGGFGTRLWPLKLPVPKPLVDINGKTLTERVFDILKDSGVSDAILSIHYEAEKMKAYFGSGKKFGMRLSYAYEEQPLGTAGPLIVLNKEGKAIRSHFFMINCDDLFERIDLRAVMEFHRASNAIATIVLTTVEDVSSFGVAQMEGCRITRFIEKPKKEEAPSNLVNSGYYVLSPEIFEIAEAIKKPKVMMETDIFPKVASMRRLYGFVSKGFWIDTGTPERLALAREKFK